MMTSGSPRRGTAFKCFPAATAAMAVRSFLRRRFGVRTTSDAGPAPAPATPPATPAQTGRGGAPAPQFVSPEVLPDKRLTFRIYAPQAEADQALGR